MTLEDAFLTGFIKAALSLPATPKMPEVTLPPPTKMSVNLQPIPKISDFFPLMPSRPVNNSPSSAPPSIPPIPKRAPNALTSFPITAGPNTNYTFNVFGDKIHTFTNTPPNTLDINAHGGAFRRSDLYEKDNGYYSPSGFEKSLKEPKDIYGMVADPKAEPVNKANHTLFLGDSEINPFTEEDMANRIGSHTNDIRQIRSSSCNAGQGCRTNINPNSIVKGYNTPAYLKSIYPNLTNAIIQPPGTYSLLRPNGRFLNNNPIERLISRLQMESHNLPNPEGAQVEYPHQYGLQDNGWVDKGPYYNY